jgi:hypothetical protein
VVNRQSGISLTSRRSAWLWALAVPLLAGCLSAAQPAPGQADSGPLRFVAHYAVPGEGSVYTDVRWANDGSVLLSRWAHGVFEMELGDKPVTRQQPVPSPFVLRPSLTHPPKFDSLAVSPQYLAIASLASNITWRSRERSPSGKIVFEHKTLGNVDDIDLWGDRVVFLGAPLVRTTHPDSPYEAGGIAWLGTLSSGLDDIKPVLFDLAGSAADHYWTCSTLRTGSVRFLENGSFVVVPGYQPGAHLFNAAGKLVRSWSGEETGLTTDCSGMAREDGYRMRATFEGVRDWLNQRRILDDVVPLADGIGLVVRYLGTDAKLHWELRVLRANTAVATYRLPIESHVAHSRLHADARGGRLVFLLSSMRLMSNEQSDLDGELFLAELR